MESIILNDWMTTPESRIGTQITGDDRDRVYHSHDFYEIFYVIESSITHIVNSKKDLLKTGDIVFIRLTDTHRFRRESGNTCTHRDIVINPQQFYDSCNFIDPELFNRLTKAPTPPKANLSLGQINYFEKSINRIMNTTGGPNDAKKSALINVLMVELLGVFIKAEFASTPIYSEWLEFLIARFHMNEHLKSGLDEILKETNMNKSYVCAAFKKYTGVTMSEYLCQVRLNYAANLLQFTDNKIADICNEIGFSSIPHFYNKFAQRFACSPKEFRNKSRKTQENDVLAPPET